MRGHRRRRQWRLKLLLLQVRDGMADEISVQAPVSQCERWLFCGERWMCRCDATERWMCRCDAESCGVKRGGVKPLHFVGTTWSLAMFS